MTFSKVQLEMGEEKTFQKGVYLDEELNVLIGLENKLKLAPRGHAIKRNKLGDAIEMIISLNELGNTTNLEDGRPSNALFTYHVIDPKEFRSFEPVTPQSKKLKNGNLTSLNLKITDQDNNVINNGPGTTF